MIAGLKNSLFRMWKREFAFQEGGLFSLLLSAWAGLPYAGRPAQVLVEDCQDVFLGQDEVFLTIQLELGARILGE